MDDWTKKLGTLSRRELEVLRLMSKGNKRSEVAEKLGITMSTVQALSTRASNKLGTRHPWHAAILYLLHELGPAGEYDSWGRA